MSSTYHELYEALCVDAIEEKQQAFQELERAGQRISEGANSVGLFGLAALPLAVVAGMLVATMQMVLQKQLEELEAMRLENKLKDAASRAPTGVSMPTEEFIRRYGRV